MDPALARQWVDRGLAFISNDDHAAAEASFREALRYQDDSPDALNGLAAILQATGRVNEALPVFFRLVARYPGNAQMRRNLAGALNGFAMGEAAPWQREILTSLCLDDRISILLLCPSLVSLMKGDAGFQAVLEHARRDDDGPVPADAAAARFLRDSLVLAALPRMPVADVELERAFTYLRRRILLDFGRGAEGHGKNLVVPAEFACALARQCFFSGYAFHADAHEQQRVAALRDALRASLREADLEPRAREPALVVAASYGSLNSLPESVRLQEVTASRWSEPFRPLVQEQVANRLLEQRIARDIVAITPINDRISAAVRAQYEENPYPRWVTVQSPGTETIEALDRRLRPGTVVRDRPRPVSILVAGCGTGHNPIQYARAYPDCEILAVDLSLASLAYAARMTERLGVTGITYCQADILELGSLDRRFALIECSGVLHHLADPIAGWKVLNTLLDADGLMKIALYSEKARGAIRAAREFTASLALPPTADGLRASRHAMIALPPGHPARGVMTYADFYSLDGCRDMIMHVQEHQFTLPRVEACLDELGLRFLAMECTPETLARFKAMFADDAAATSLAAWDQFEEAWPDTFIGMYPFWCGRK